jgi:hypothetical protein
MQKPATVKALLAGCWKLFEGLYFDVWDYQTMVVKLQDIPMEWWQSWWIGADYGYSGSIAAAGLFTRTQDGTVYLVAEHPCGDLSLLQREKVRTFARSVYDKFAKMDAGQEQARNIEAMFLGPDSWNDQGDERTLAGQMNEELSPHGLEFVKAKNDRAGGAQLIYTMLQNYQLKIAHTCTNTIEAIESRLHDEKEPVKVRKVPTDPLDDFYDFARYGIYSYLETPTKPYGMRVAERLKKAIEVDPMAAHWRLQQNASFIVTSRLGLVGSSGAYVSRYLDGRPLPSSVSLDQVAKVASRIGQMSGGRLRPRAA